MKILIIGGGPGGLYAGLLLKKANPSYEIEIIERNPAGATYGWGVVFSDRTLAAFREADPKSYQDITDNFVIWHAINVHYRDQLVRSGGHTFAGLSRRLLLNILQQRCYELGVRMTFEQEVNDLSLISEYDLVIAADGLNSVVRHTYADSFQPTLDVGKAKYIWLGTDKVLDAFTFIFRENEHGLFQVHAYSFDGQTSTFIVECTEAVWKQAGLDKVDEAGSITYCQELFAEFLGGATLMSNKSEWINFVTVRNKTWRHENIVLLGDSAHTAHFSIGSGTKLAMDDAIALAGAFERQAELQVALDEYEMERRPRVEILQQAAMQSQSYFEEVQRYLHLEPWQFAFYLLTRSGRITYDNLRVRDPYFVDDVDRLFSAATGKSDEAAPTFIAPPPLFMPLKLRDLTLPNRAAVSLVSTYEAVQGVPGKTLQKELHRQAQGGGSLVMTMPVAVSADGRITPGCPGLYHQNQLAPWRQIVDLVHEHTSAAVALQLNHAGRRGSTRPRQEGLDRPLRSGNWPLLSASPIPYSTLSQTPREMNRSDMDQVRESFVRAAQMADEASFDMLQLHMAHGYLLASFLSPLANKRHDEYGGSLDDRLRFPLEVFDAVRAVWPEHKPLSVALTVTDWARGGTTIHDAVTVAHVLKAHGCDLIEVLAGQTIPFDRPVYGPGFLTPYSDQIRLEAGMTTMVGGYIPTSGQANNILAAGRADLCIMAHV